MIQIPKGKFEKLLESVKALVRETSAGFRKFWKSWLFSIKAVARRQFKADVRLELIDQSTFVNPTFSTFFNF